MLPHRVASLTALRAVNPGLIREMRRRAIRCDMCVGRCAVFILAAPRVMWVIVLVAVSGCWASVAPVTRDGPLPRPTHRATAAIRMFVGIGRTESSYGTSTRLAPAGRPPPRPVHQIQSFMKKQTFVVVLLACSISTRVGQSGSSRKNAFRHG